MKIMSWSSRGGRGFLTWSSRWIVLVFFGVAAVDHIVSCIYNFSGVLSPVGVFGVVLFCGRERLTGRMGRVLQ